ncbi:MAG: hypothetical protein WCE62_00410 [Polyangiales bacterium]
MRPLLVLWGLGIASAPVHIAKAEPEAEPPPPAAETAPASRRPFPTEAFVRLELHYSFLTELADRSDLIPAFGYALKGGYRWGFAGLFLQFEQDFWVGTEYDVRVTQGAYNIAVGMDFTYFEGRIHTSIAAGPSILAFDTPLDSRGSVGWFLDFRPVGFQWDVHRFVRLGLDPISFAVVAPSLDGVPLVQIEYRTTFYLETPF